MMRSRHAAGRLREITGLCSPHRGTDLPSQILLKRTRHFLKLWRIFYRPRPRSLSECYALASCTSSIGYGPCQPHVFRRLLYDQRNVTSTCTLLC